MATRNVNRAKAQCRAIQQSSPFLYDLSATLWERLTKSEQAEWMRDQPEAATEAKNEKRRSVF